MKTKLLTLFLLAASTQAFAQYNASAAQNAPKQKVVESYRDEKSGETKTRTVERDVAKDVHGNAQGNQFDLAVDGAFEGQTVAVLQLYTGEGFDFSAPKAALK